MKKFANLFIIIITSLITTYKVLLLGLLLLSNSVNSISTGGVGIKSTTQTFSEIFFVAIFLSVSIYFIKTKQKAMILISSIGLVSHIALLLIIP